MWMIDKQLNNLSKNTLDLPLRPISSPIFPISANDTNVCSNQNLQGHLCFNSAPSPVDTVKCMPSCPPSLPLRWCHLGLSHHHIPPEIQEALHGFLFISTLDPLQSIHCRAKSKQHMKLPCLNLAWTPHYIQNRTEALPWPARPSMNRFHLPL